MRAVVQGVEPPVGRPSVQPGQPVQLTEHKAAAWRATAHISPADCSAAHLFWRPGQDTLYYLKSFNFSYEPSYFLYSLGSSSVLSCSRCSRYCSFTTFCIFNSFYYFLSLSLGFPGGSEPPGSLILCSSCHKPPLLMPGPPEARSPGCVFDLS